MVEITRKKEVEGLSSGSIDSALDKQLEIEKLKAIRSLREPRTRRPTTASKSDFGKAVDILKREIDDRERLESVVNKFRNKNPITEVLDTPFGKGIGEAVGGLITELTRGYMENKAREAIQARAETEKEGRPPMPTQTQMPPQPQATLALGEEDKRIIEEQKRSQEEIVNKLSVATNVFSDAMKKVETVMSRIDNLEKKIIELEVKPEEETVEEIEEIAEPEEVEEVVEHVEEIADEIPTEEPKVEIEVTTADKEEEYYNRQYLTSLKLKELKELGREKFDLTDEDYIGKKKKQIIFLIGKRQRLLKQS